MDELAKIYRSGSVPDKRRTRDRPGQKKKRRKALRLLARSRLDALIRMADEAHRLLEEQHSPFRFRIYEREGDVFIDVVTLDAAGKPDQVFHQDISHQELEALVRQIKTGRGLVFDARA